MPEYTLGDIDARVLARLDNNSLLYPQAQRYSEINDALRIVNLVTAYAMDSVDVPGFTVAGQLIYIVPPSILIPLRVYYENRQLEMLSMRSVAMRYRTWATDRSNRGMPVQEWVPMGLGMFAIHPMDSTGGQSLTVNGIVELAPLVIASDLITIPDNYVELIEELVAHVLQIKESSAIFSQASVLYQKFIRDVKQYKYWESISFPRYFIMSNQATQAAEMGDDGAGQ